VKRILLAIAVVVALVGQARAGIIFQLGNNPQPGEENILLNTGTTGATVFGMTQNSMLTAAFSSTTDTLTEPSNGQARVEAVDGLVNNISISVPGHTFGDLIINSFNGTGTAMLTAVANDGTATFSY